MEEKGKSFKEGVIAGLPTAMGYISIGLACGVIAAPYMSAVEMFLMSFLIYAGGAQFVMTAMIATGTGILDITLTVFLINLRFLLLSLHASTHFRRASLLQNIGIGTLLTDESYGVLMGESVHSDVISTSWMNGNNVVSYLSWGIATVIGVLLGDLLPNPEQFGFDFALVGMFIGIFSSQFLAMLKRESLVKLLQILGAVIISFLLLTMFVTSSVAVLLSTLIGCFVGVMMDAK